MRTRTFVIYSFAKKKESVGGISSNRIEKHLVTFVLITEIERISLLQKKRNAAKCDYSFNNFVIGEPPLFMLPEFNISQITKLFTYQTILTSF